MSSMPDSSWMIRHAARLARGDRFAELRRLCESQSSIGTRRLLAMIEKIEAADRRDAISVTAYVRLRQDQ